MQADTGIIAFHHALVQLLAELCSGLANEVEMYVQSVVPLHEACAHICDGLCPYAIRASFFALLMEAYTVTSLKVQGLAHSPAVWQVVAVLVSELRSLLECIAGHGDADDRAQAILSIQASNRGPSFVEAGLWFCVGFIEKHTTAGILAPDHKSCFASLQLICVRLLNVERARDTARARRRRNEEIARKRSTSAAASAATSADRRRGQKGGQAATRHASPPSKANNSNGAAGYESEHPGEGADAADRHAAQSAVAADVADIADGEGGTRALLQLGPHQLTLLAACVHALEKKGIGAGASLWRNVSSAFGLASKRQPRAAAAPTPSGAAAPAPNAANAQSTSLSRPPSPKKESSGLSAHARRRKATLSDLKDDDDDEGAPADQADQATAGAGSSAGAADEKGTTTDGQPSKRRLLLIEDDDNGLAASCKIGEIVSANRAWLEAWATQEFENSVRLFKEDKESLRPVIDQLKGKSSEARVSPAAAAASAWMQERCLRVLQALLAAEPSLQNRLDAMGVTSVVLATLAAPSTPRSFDAALELGIALLDNGNRRVQTTVYATLSSAGSNAPLASLASTLHTVVHKVEMCARGRIPCRTWFPCFLVSLLPSLLACPSAIPLDLRACLQSGNGPRPSLDQRSCFCLPSPPTGCSWSRSSSAGTPPFSSRIYTWRAPRGR